MKILIINPNSSNEMTEAIQKSAEIYANGEFSVTTFPTDGAPDFIETYEDILRSAPGMIETIREHENEYDAFVIACHYDPNLDAMKEITKKPVIGIGEASMKIATMLGHRFSVVTTAKHSVPIKEDLIRKYHLQDMLASVKAPECEFDESFEEDEYYDLAKAAIDEDMAEVIVLGCAGLAGMDKKLQERLGVPVLDGIICALIIATGLVKCGVSTSKIRKYNPEDFNA
jgi:allantoin racemase